MNDITELAQREKFEVWAHSQKLSLAYGDCGYAFSSTEMAWRAWMASSAELVEALDKSEKTSEARREAIDRAHNMFVRERDRANAAEEALEKAQQRIAELESSGVAPGILRCTECSFVLTKNIISVTADTITTVESESEPCPNGCGQLLPATWKALAIHLMFTTKQGVSDLLEAKKRIAELESRAVKLPESFKLAKSSSGLTYYYADEVDAALTAAGIKVEAE
ncbi:hypothetical protein AB4R36_17985 [Klebsiella pneumoniae]|uniref:hypothetical protein n=1 Tax=Klebsiella pneumoniae TaxID=573 RepID=UPI0034C6059B